eukprot:TRINITY_DN6907_c0_g1_i11.p1 TRINITY_DN6907_c0_g1~~TRINITY_DN6907_c0_g1_i11.p1  ORF type:complete len:702 (-),score=203.02 TRINITY_DN6907_c0_g1_i11:36-2141(-)
MQSTGLGAGQLFQSGFGLGFSHQQTNNSSKMQDQSGMAFGMGDSVSMSGSMGSSMSPASVQSNSLENNSQFPSTMEYSGPMDEGIGIKTADLVLSDPSPPVVPVNTSGNLFGGELLIYNPPEQSVQQQNGAGGGFTTNPGAFYPPQQQQQQQQPLQVLPPGYSNETVNTRFYNSDGLGYSDEGMQGQGQTGQARTSDTDMDSELDFWNEQLLLGSFDGLDVDVSSTDDQFQGGFSGGTGMIQQQSQPGQLTGGNTGNRSLDGGSFTDDEKQERIVFVSGRNQRQIGQRVVFQSGQKQQSKQVQHQVQHQVQPQQTRLAQQHQQSQQSQFVQQQQQQRQQQSKQQQYKQTQSQQQSGPISWAQVATSDVKKEVSGPNRGGNNNTNANANTNTNTYQTLNQGGHSNVSLGGTNTPSSSLGNVWGKPGNASTKLGVGNTSGPKRDLSDIGNRQNSMTSTSSSSSSMMDQQSNSMQQEQQTLLQSDVVVEKVNVDELRLIVNPLEFSIDLGNCKGFVIKTYSEVDVHKSIQTGTWKCNHQGYRRLSKAWNSLEEDGQILLFCSINGTGKFCGMAEMRSDFTYTKSLEERELERDMRGNSTDDEGSQYGDESETEQQEQQMSHQKGRDFGEFQVKWIYVKDIPSASLKHIRMPNNFSRAMPNSRDGQEILPEQLRPVIEVFVTYQHNYSVLENMEQGIIGPTYVWP